MKKFDIYRRNLAVLQTAKDQDITNEFIISGIIDKFSIQFELGWKVLKELLLYEGSARAKTGSPREIIKEAYRYYPCMDEDVWLSMLSQRNNMAHLYDGEAAKEFLNRILSDYIPAFQKLEKIILDRYHDLLEPEEDAVSCLTDSLTGVLKGIVDLDQARKECLAEKYTVND